MDELLSQIYQGAATLLALALVYAVRIALAKGQEYLALKLGNERLLFLKENAFSIVRYLEQSGTLAKLGADQKKEQALAYLDMIATEKGIQIDFDELDRLIEEAVQVMNAELAKDPLFVEYVDGGEA
jgi:hypothetical protein